ncbi:unnamed protein product, partial [Heterosigma akashiwo]
RAGGRTAWSSTSSGSRRADWGHFQSPYQDSLTEQYLRLRFFWTQRVNYTIISEKLLKGARIWGSGRP